MSVSTNSLADEETPAHFSRPSRPAYYLVVLIGCLAFVVLGVHREPRLFKSRDFKQPYASARCLLAHCNPYSEQDTQVQYFSARGPNNDSEVFIPYSALYPPPSLLLLLPVAALPYPAAHAVWMALQIVSFIGAALLIANLCEGYASWLAILALAFFVWNSNELIVLGQITTIAIALACAGFWAMLRGRILPASLCIACALCLKPHDIVFFLPYFLLAGVPWRKALLGIVGIAAAFTLAGVLWCSLTPASAHWLGDLRANIAGNSAPGSVNDPAPANPKADAIVSLQAVFSVVDQERSFYTTTSYATTAILFLIWLYGTTQMQDSEKKHLLSIAFLACLTLLPIYHRQYDTRLLLLAFPATALLLARRPRLGIVALALLCVQIFPRIAIFMERISHSPGHMGPLLFLLTYRVTQIDVLALAVFFLVVFTREARAGNAALKAA